MPRSTQSLAVSKGQQEQIERWLAAFGTSQQVALRCRIVLAAGCGETETAIAAALKINRMRMTKHTVDGARCWVL